MLHGVRAAMRSLKKTGTDWSSAQGMDPKAFFKVMGLDEVVSLDADWPEAKERAREWVDFPEALRRMAWKQELAQGLALCSLNTQLPRR